MSNTETIINDIKIDTINLIRLKKGRALKKLLDKAYNLLAKDDINRFFHFVGECFLEEPYHFLSKWLYPYYLKKIKKLFNKNHSQMLALESYIIQNFSLIQGEQLVDAFKGTLGAGNGYFLKGRLYLTNFRIIGHGLHAVNTDSDTGSGIKKVGILYKHQRRMSNSISDHLHQRSQVPPCFGYQFPIFGVSDVNRKAKNLIFRCSVDFKSRKGNVKSKTYKFRIHPLRVKELESKPDFYIRREQNFDTIQKLFSDLNQVAYQ